MVVSNGAFKIDSELQIQAKPSMMSPSGGAATTGHEQHATITVATSNTNHEETAVERSNENVKARETLLPVYNQYFDVQMALAKDDLVGAKKAGANLVTVTKHVDMSVFSRSGHGRWMELSKVLTKHADQISSAKNIEAARDGFFYLSKSMIDVHKTFGHAGKEDYYLTHCPMARDGDGAYWLQTENIVWNSFYGEAMLRCGSIKETLASLPEGKR
jgi:Cu(I)/Ag(I) efflux system membrane fusion protein